MSNRIFDSRKLHLFLLLLAILSASCNTTQHLRENQFLVKQNKVILKSEYKITNRGELKESLNHYVIQKPNTYTFNILPLKLWRYNRRYDKYSIRPDTSLPKSVERPVVLDTSLTKRSVQNMKKYLFRQGYFYAKIEDTISFRKKKAYPVYTVTLGNNFLIKNVNYDMDDSSIAKIVRGAMDESVLTKGKEYTYGLMDEERGRITTLLRNNGYYRFTLDNVTFVIDTFDKSLFRNAESPFQSAINFISTTKNNGKPTVDINIYIRIADDSLAYKKHYVRSVTVYPDFRSAADLKDSTMITKTIDSITFKYHKNYVHANVLYQHIYLSPGTLYSQADFDKTIVKLNELGIFQYLRIQPREERRNRGTLDMDILLNRTKKYDFSTNYEISSGTTYALGNSVGVNYRDRNILKGANLFTFGVNGGVELAYNSGNDVVSNFTFLTKYYGANTSIDFPKFLAPIGSSLFDNSNLPHTIIGAGTNVIERVDYFTLANTRANFTYSWRQTQTKTWMFSPAFMNIIRLPNSSDSFKKVLSVNEYLRNSYKENFIEGENITFTYDNNQKKRGVNNSFLKVSLEEAGGLLSIFNTAEDKLTDKYTLQYAQYTKFDFDARRYFTFPHSTIALRFYGGVGVPYDKSPTLPYIKQYFAGGPYSLRGWRIRTLGPGSYFLKDTTNTSSQSFIDRTGDIKLELNGEYRFPIAPLFAGVIKMNGAIFADAGNIWFAKKNKDYPGGEIEWSTFGQEIATDIGVGARFDIASFIIVRLDVAMPVKKPYVNSNNGWVFREIDLGNATWRSQNIIPQISIGYPF